MFNSDGDEAQRGKIVIIVLLIVIFRRKMTTW